VRGSTGFAFTIINKYFDVYFERAINTSAVLRQHNPPYHYVYTTQAFLTSLYLDCIDPSQWTYPAPGEPSSPSWSSLFIFSLTDARVCVWLRQDYNPTVRVRRLCTVPMPLRSKRSSVRSCAHTHSLTHAHWRAHMHMHTAIDCRMCSRSSSFWMGMKWSCCVVRAAKTR
jgi:hypothetical protein